MAAPCFLCQLDYPVCTCAAFPRSYPHHTFAESGMHFLYPCPLTLPSPVPFPGIAWSPTGMHLRHMLYHGYEED